MNEEGINNKQQMEEAYRRWFFNNNCELILWYDRPDGKPTGFQWCYEKTTYDETAGYFDTSVETGYKAGYRLEANLFEQITDTLAEDGTMLNDKEDAGFIHISRNIDTGSIDMVLCLMDEYDNRVEK